MTETSNGVDSGISRKMTMHRLCTGRTFLPSSSTWTYADSVQTYTQPQKQCKLATLETDVSDLQAQNCSAETNRR